MTSSPVPFVVALLAVLALSGAAHAADRPTPRLRILDPHLRALVHDGMQQSPSFRALVTRLDAFDVVVYATVAPLPVRLAGQLTFVSSAGGFRYVVVQLNRELSASRKLATLGHELQHANEIADRPAIVDTASLRREFEQFGFARERVARARAFDTRAAVDAGDKVWREIAGAASNMD